MAKLYFYHGAMNAGKSTTLLQASYNYKERGMKTLLLLPSLDTRDKQGYIHSRIGLAACATTFERDTNLFEKVQRLAKEEKLHCVLIDEAQFLSPDQVTELCKIVDQLKLPVLTYGLRTDFQGSLFPGSRRLLALADEIVEIKTMCHCGKKATMNMRVDSEGKQIVEGPQVQIGGQESYVGTCRYHHGLGQGYAP